MGTSCTENYRVMLSDWLMNGLGGCGGKNSKTCYLASMKIVLDIPDSKVGFMMELLRSLSFVKAKPLPVGISNEKALFLTEFSEAVDELNDVLVGKTQARDAYELLDEL